MYKISANTQNIGRKIHYLPNCHSTNDITAELCREGQLEPGDIVITDHQEKGRGQRGRQWDTEPHANLTFSFLIKPSGLPVSDLFFLNIMASLAIIDVLEELGTPGFRIKWPNDIYYLDDKLGGILIENSLRGHEFEYAIIGIGLNANQTHFSSAYRATSLKRILGHQTDLNDLLNRLAERLDWRYGTLLNRDTRILKSEYLERLYRINEDGIFSDRHGRFRGMIEGIDEHGRLMIRTVGEIRTYGHKEVTFENQD